MIWGDTHNILSPSFFHAFSLFSCFALSSIPCHCVQSCPLVPPSFPLSHALCVALARSLCPLLYACPSLPAPFARMHALFVYLGHALKLLFIRMHFATFFFSFLVPLFPSFTYSLGFARCLMALMPHFPFHCHHFLCDLLLSLPLCLHVSCYLPIYSLGRGLLAPGSASSCTHDTCYLFVGLSTYCTWRRARVGVVSSCIHDICYLFVPFWTPCTWRRPRVSVWSQCTHDTWYLHAIFLLGCVLFVLGDAQE